MLEASVAEFGEFRGSYRSELLVPRKLDSAFSMSCIGSRSLLVLGSRISHARKKHVATSTVSCSVLNGFERFCVG